MNILELLKRLFRKNKVVHTPVEGSLLVEPPKPEDWLFGASNFFDDKHVQNPSMDWTNSLPVEESQIKAKAETMSCVTHAFLNAIEIVTFVKYGIRENWSERFTAKMSGTTRNGNSFANVMNSIRKDGCVPETKWAFDDSMTWDDFYKTIFDEIKKLGQEWGYTFNHLYVNMKNDAEVKKAMIYSPLVIAVNAWYERNGRYFNPQPGKYNHATLIIKPDIGDGIKIFDSYNPYLKWLEKGTDIYEWGVAVDVTKIGGNTEGEKLFNRLKGKLILLPYSNGEMYRVMEDHLRYVVVNVGDEQLAKKFHQYLRDSKVLTGLTNEDFSKLKQYMKERFGEAKIVEGNFVGLSELLKG